MSLWYFGYGISLIQAVFCIGQFTFLHGLTQVSTFLPVGLLLHVVCQQQASMAVLVSANRHHGTLTDIRCSDRTSAPQTVQMLPVIWNRSLNTL